VKVIAEKIGGDYALVVLYAEIDTIVGGQTKRSSTTLKRLMENG